MKIYRLSNKGVKSTWRAKVEGIQVIRLKYLKGWELLYLKRLVRAFLKKWGFLRKSRKSAFSDKKLSIMNPTRNVFEMSGHRSTPNYEASNIVNTVDSDYWRWRRVKEFWKEYQWT